MTRYHLQAAALTLGCAVAASSSAPATGILRGGGEQGGEMDDLNNENFKENEDWWKDPFAMFDEDEDDNGGGVMEGDDLEMMEELPELTEEEASPQVNEDDFLIIEEPEPEPEPVVEPESVEPVQEEEAPAAASKGWGGWASRGNNNNKAEAAAASEQDAASPEHNPLVEQAMVTSQRASLADNPKLQTMWKALPFFNSLLASFAFIKVVQPVIEQATERHQSNIFSKNSQQYYDDNDHDHQYSRSHDSRRNTDDEHQLDDDDDDRSSLQQKQRASPPKKEKSFGFGGGMFGGRKPKKYVEKLPPARELMELVEALQREVDTLKVEKEAVDAEYEKTSWTLQETQNEMANLQSTTQYLKAQLRDNAEIMDRAVRAERRKARDELTKMKEAMLQVLQRERAELRAKMLKQTQEVQAILKEQQSSSSSSKNNNTGDQLMTTTG